MSDICPVTLNGRACTKPRGHYAQERTPGHCATLLEPDRGGSGWFWHPKCECGPRFANDPQVIRASLVRALTSGAKGGGA